MIVNRILGGLRQLVCSRTVERMISLVYFPCESLVSRPVAFHLSRIVMKIKLSRMLANFRFGFLVFRCNPRVVHPELLIDREEVDVLPDALFYLRRVLSKEPQNPCAFDRRSA